MNSHYHSVNEYLKDKYGEKIYKLALNGGFTCPNRDGSKGAGGCTFCGEGSGSFASASIDEAIDKLAGKHTGDHYIAYFQSFTGTYKISEDLTRRFYQAARDERIRIISIATRPDCLQDEVLLLLKDLQQYKPIWVELGLQTMHEKTAQSINRHFTLQEFEEGVRKLRELKIDIIVHLILGLPGESREDMLESVRYLNRQDIQGVKLQLLHVLKGTALEKQLPEMENYPLTLEEYTDLLGDCIENLREDIIVHRITGDAPKKDLLSPLWSGDKKRVLNYIRQQFDACSIRQGARYHS